MKNLPIALAIILTVTVLFTEVGYQAALDIVSLFLDKLFALANNI